MQGYYRDSYGNVLCHYELRTHHVSEHKIHNDDNFYNVSPDVRNLDS